MQIQKKMSNWELNRELKEINKERDIYSKELDNKRQHMADMLLGDMGKDIENVLSGNVKIKLTFWEKLKYKIRYYIDIIFYTL